MTEKQTISIAMELAKAHLETILTDYIIIGFNRSKEGPLVLQDYYNCASVEVLSKLYELFLQSAEQKINKPEK